MASLNRNGIIISCGNFSRKLPWIPIAVLNVSFKDVEYRFCGFPIVSLDCQVNQVMVMGKTRQDTSQNLASSNHNCDFPPNQKKQGNPAGQKNSRWTKAGVSKVHLLYPIAEKNREKSEISG